MAGMRGVVAFVKWHYYNAAALNGYTVNKDTLSGRWSASGTVVLSDAFKLSQRPLFFVAPLKGGAIRWEIDTYALAESGAFTATLRGGPSQETPNGITRQAT
jgi:hypothetical protein